MTTAEWQLLCLSVFLIYGFMTICEKLNKIIEALYELNRTQRKMNDRVGMAMDDVSVIKIYAADRIDKAGGKQ